MPTAPSDQSCHIFYPEGGAVSWQAPPKEMQDTVGATEYVYTGAVEVSLLGTGSGAEGKELMVFTLVSEAVCSELNFAMGVTAENVAPPQYTNGFGIGPPPVNWWVYGNFNVSRGGYINNGYIGTEAIAICVKSKTI